MPWAKTRLAQAWAKKSLRLDSDEESLRESIATSATGGSQASSRASIRTSRSELAIDAMNPESEKRSSAIGSPGRERAIPKWVSESARTRKLRTTTSVMPTTAKASSVKPPGSDSPARSGSRSSTVSSVRTAIRPSRMPDSADARDDSAVRGPRGPLPNSASTNRTTRAPSAGIRTMLIPAPR